jgi:hypothetical protein
MLLSAEYRQPARRLAQALHAVPVVPDGFDLGDDIETANAALLDPGLTAEQKQAIFFAWSAKHQPCLFGRLGSRGQRGIGIDMVWIDDADIDCGDHHVMCKIQYARRSWKDRAIDGRSSAFLIMLNTRKACYARQGPELLELCRVFCELYLVETVPILPDVIYTEAVPLRDAEGQLSVYKAGINVFYGGAHRTMNHDRRIPGGLMISVNAPGHYVNTLVVQGVASLDDAIGQVRELTWRSIGNGGIGHDDMPSTTWHNVAERVDTASCPMKKFPSYIPPNFSREHYSGLYHTDVLIPTVVTLDDTIIDKIDDRTMEIWRWNVLFYVTLDEFETGHPYYGEFIGHRIPEEAKYHNPFAPRLAVNGPMEDAPV